jgi:hypothetical protein
LEILAKLGEERRKEILEVNIYAETILLEYRIEHDGSRFVAMDSKNQD